LARRLVNLKVSLKLKRVLFSCKLLVTLNQWFSNFFAYEQLKKYPMDHFAMLIPHEQLVETFLERLIKDL